MTSPSTHLALDLGTVTAKIALGEADENTITSPAPDAGWQARVSGALAAADVTPPAGGFFLAIPEAWLDASVDGTTTLESLRQACEEELGITEVTWVGQLAAVAAFTARRRRAGRYLVCDIGAAGVRTGALDVTEQAVQIVAVHSASGGGWRDFDAAILALPHRVPADWHQQAMAQDQDRRARTLFGQLASRPDVRESPVYRFTGPDGDSRLLTGEVVDCFAPTRKRIRAGAAYALAAGPADVAVLTGGLGWLPLAQVVLAEAVGIEPVVEAPDAAARGALLFALGTVRPSPPMALAQVTMPAHRIRNGELEEVGIALPWTEPFARPADGPLVIEEPELAVDIAGQRTTVSLPGFVPGPYLVGVRSGWSGSAALVVRPAVGSGAPVVVALGARSR